MATAFINSTGQPNADWYYQLFKQEPVLPSGTVSIDSRVPLEGLTVQSLLTAIAATEEKKMDVLVVCHGTQDGLSIPLVADSEAFLQKSSLEALFQYEDEPKKADKIAPLLFFSKEDLLAFWELVTSVRKLRLGRLEWRACATGNSQATLKLLKRFFGSSSCCAPRGFDIFGPLQVSPGPDSISTLLRFFPHAEITGKPPNRFGLYVGPTNEFNTGADSMQAVTDWVKTHLPGRDVQVETRFPVHGIRSLDIGRMLWAGEPGYRRFLQKV